jgi:aminoglycoside phosphotransferase (APT) family kinase protein
MQLGEIVAQGAQAQIFALGQDRVLKLFRPAYGAAAVEAEAHKTAAVHALGYPVPQPYDVVEHHGRHGFVMERLVGPSLVDVVLRGPGRDEELAVDFAELQVRLGKLSTNELAPIEVRLDEKLARAPVPEDSRDLVRRCLRACPRGDGVYHGDFHPGNVVSTERGLYVVDWFGAGRAHPAADVAQTRLLIATALLPDLPLQARERLRAGRERFDSAYLQRYLELSSVARSDVLLWMRPLAAARLYDEQGLASAKSDWPLLRAIATGARTIEGME